MVAIALGALEAEREDPSHHGGARKLESRGSALKIEGLPFHVVVGDACVLVAVGIEVVAGLGIEHEPVVVLLLVVVFIELGVGVEGVTRRTRRLALAATWLSRTTAAASSAASAAASTAASAATVGYADMETAWSR